MKWANSNNNNSAQQWTGWLQEHVGCPVSIIITIIIELDHVLQDLLSNETLMSGPVSTSAASAALQQPQIVGSCWATEQNRTGQDRTGKRLGLLLKQFTQSNTDFEQQLQVQSLTSWPTQERQHARAASSNRWTVCRVLCKQALLDVRRRVPIK